MKELKSFCMSVTPFTRNGDLDEEALRAQLQRFIDARLGVLLGSGGEGEGHTLTPAEARRIYAIGVEECAGRIPVYANLPGEMTAQATIRHAQLAVDAGIEVVHFYLIEGRHGMQPTDAELTRYLDDVLSVVRHPVGLAINSGIGYIARPELIADICHRYAQIVELRLTHVPDIYLIKLKALIKRPMVYYAQFSSGPFNPLILGVDGLFGSEANVIPATCRRFIDLYQQRKLDDIGAVYADIRRFSDYISGFGRPSLRAVKMCMKALKLPGGEGGPRHPYLMPPDDLQQKFTAGLLDLHVPEIDALARAAGL